MVFGAWVLAMPALADSPLDRPSDPVIVRGADVPTLSAASLTPSDIVAFRYEDGWIQIPVQVDERDVVEIDRIYGAHDKDINPTGVSYGPDLYDEFYTDPNTFTGPDANPLFDPNDEIVFMAADAGAKAPEVANPTGTLAGSGVEIRIDDPLDAKTGYVYLFLRDGDSLEPGAGEQYVQYDFSLLSGDYKSTYLLQGLGNDHGPLANPEDSLVTTAHYQRHWSWRWTCDGLRIFDGSGEDFFERRDYWIRPGVCGRNNASFNAQEGCFIVNKSGPVRALRAYMGANSGPWMQTNHHYYAKREDITVTVRVHARGAIGIMYNDYDEPAFGMTYANELNPAGAMVDGSPDTLTLGPTDWEMLTGPQGSLVLAHNFEADFAIPPEEITHFYEDALNTSTYQCQACEECDEVEIINDPHMIGASGPFFTGPLPNTDPRQGECQRMKMYTVNYYDAPGLATADAEKRCEWAYNPLETSTAPLGGGTPGTNSPPQFNLDPLVLPDAEIASRYSASIADAATDTDGDALTYYKVDGPGWLHVRTDGTLVGMPGVAEGGQQNWTVMVIDGHGGSDTATLQLEVVVEASEEQVFTFITTDDAHTQEGTDQNFGGNVGIQVKKDEIIGWVKFAVEGLPDGTIVGEALLRLHAGPESMCPDDATAHAVSDVSWTELSITGLNHPSVGAALDTVIGVQAGTWNVFDVTDAVTGNGEVAFALTDTTTENNRGWYSRETANEPELQITITASGNHPPTFDATEYTLPNATAGVPYSASIHAFATDEDAGDALTFTRACCSGRPWLQVAPDGHISGTPTAADVGTDAYTVMVEDPAGEQDYAVLFVTVEGGIPDTDGDGLPDNIEALLGTFSNNPDSDGDNVSDFDEVNWDEGWTGNAEDYAPFHPTDRPAGTDLDAMRPDTDEDELDDGDEIAEGTDPLNPDSDDDTLLDGEEVMAGRNPLAPDLDITTDISGDTNVNALDVQLIVNAALGMGIAGNGDVNRDGAINALDVQLVILRALGVVL